MKSPPLHDPALQALEADLAARVPRLPAEQQQQLLYRCAFAAGKQASHRQLWRWKAAAGSLAAVAAGLLVPLAMQLAADQNWESDREQRAQVHESRPIDRGGPAGQEPLVPPYEPLVPHYVAEAAPRPPAVDAWQVARSESASLDAELAAFRQTAPELQSLAAGLFVRELLND